MGVTDPRIVGTDDQVAAEDHFECSGVAVAVYLGDRRLRKRFEQVDRLGLEVGGVGARSPAAIEPRSLPAQNARPAPRSTDDTNRIIVGDRVEVITKLDERRRVHGVQLVRPEGSG